MAKIAAKRAESEEGTKAAAPRAPRKREKAHPRFFPFAFRCDGRVMINVNECKGRSLKGRERFTAVLLRPSEARIAFGRLDNGFSEAVGCIVGRMPKLKRQSAKRGAR